MIRLMRRAGLPSIMIPPLCEYIAAGEAHPALAAAYAHIDVLQRRDL